VMHKEKGKPSCLKNEFEVHSNGIKFRIVKYAVPVQGLHLLLI